MRRTSALAYQEIERNGLLSTRRSEAYRALFALGPGTTSEIARGSGIERHALQKRISELVQVGVAYEVEERRCAVTDRMVIVFDVTEKLPVQPEKRLSKLAAARMRIKELETRIEALKAELSEATVGTLGNSETGQLGMFGSQS